MESSRLSYIAVSDARLLICWHLDSIMINGPCSRLAAAARLDQRSCSLYISFSVA